MSVLIPAQFGTKVCIRTNGSAFTNKLALGQCGITVFMNLSHLWQVGHLTMEEVGADHVMHYNCKSVNSWVQAAHLHGEVDLVWTSSANFVVAVHWESGDERESWGSKVTCIFNKLHSKAGFWHPVTICAFYKASVATYMYLCLTVSMAGCLCQRMHCIAGWGGGKGGWNLLAVAMRIITRDMTW